MNIPTIKLLQEFLNAPNLIISSDEYNFTPFLFSQHEMINKGTFVFPFNLIIGKQAEFCFAYYLMHSQRYVLLASNIQINGDTETIGEIDYLVFDSTIQATLHVELACKFYLFDSSLNTSEMNDWIGPNRKDSLKKKLDKLKLKQFPLIERKETQVTLKTLQIDSNSIKQQLCLKAFLFIGKDSQVHKFSNNFQECIVGYWIRFAEFMSEDKTAVYAIPKKKEWLLPIENSGEWFSFYKVKNLIKIQIEKNQSVLAYKKTGSQIVIFFVVWW